jgi:hypothetical protein
MDFMEAFPKNSADSPGSGRIPRVASARANLHDNLNAFPCQGEQIFWKKRISCSFHWYPPSSRISAPTPLAKQLKKSASTASEEGIFWW